MEICLQSKEFATIRCTITSFLVGGQKPHRRKNTTAGSIHTSTSCQKCLYFPHIRHFDR
uniref:Uncharacterized protein n=1 Tax=Arundo donax TaxID=35708 RepID=A0A0A9DIX3_ARUDO